MNIAASAQLKIKVASDVPFDLEGKASIDQYEEDTLQSQRLGIRLTHEAKVEEVSKEALIKAKV